MPCANRKVVCRRDSVDVVEGGAACWGYKEARACCCQLGVRFVTSTNMARPPLDAVERKVTLGPRRSFGGGGGKGRCMECCW